MRLTAEAAAEWLGLPLAEFEARVTVGAIRAPVITESGERTWLTAQLYLDTGTALTTEMRMEVEADAARSQARARNWIFVTERYLIQLGITYDTAALLITASQPPPGLPEHLFTRAQHVIGLRRRMRERLYLEQPANPDCLDEETLLDIAARRIGDGEDVFAVLTDLTVALSDTGRPERCPPAHTDPDFWHSQRSARTFRSYLAGLPQTPQLVIP